MLYLLFTFVFFITLTVMLVRLGARVLGQAIRGLSGAVGGNRTSRQSNQTRQNFAGSERPKQAPRSKIYSANDGEYVDFEEIEN